MADRQWFAEGVQVFETGTEEWFAEGVQLVEDQAAAAAAPPFILFRDRDISNVIRDIGLIQR